MPTTLTSLVLQLPTTTGCPWLRLQQAHKMIAALRWIAEQIASKSYLSAGCVDDARQSAAAGRSCQSCCDLLSHGAVRPPHPHLQPQKQWSWS